MIIDDIELAEDRKDVARDALTCLRVAMARGQLHHAIATQARYVLGCAGTLGMLDDEPVRVEGGGR